MTTHRPIPVTATYVTLDDAVADLAGATPEQVETRLASLRETRDALLATLDLNDLADAVYASKIITHVGLATAAAAGTL